MTPLTAVFIFGAKDILRLWLGPQFATNSTIVMQLVAMLFFVNAFAYIPYSSVQALGRPDLKALLDLIAIPLYLVCCWWLMHRMGINGAALAKLIVTIVDCVALYLFAFRLRALRLRDFASGPLFRALVASAGFFLAVFYLSSLHAPLRVSIALLAVALAAYLTAFWLSAVDDDDRSTIQDLVRQAAAFLGVRGPSRVVVLELDD
jgi:O-antigen/teichoic acid export membrane protein